MLSHPERNGASRRFEQQKNVTSQNQTNPTRYHLSCSYELSTPEARLQVRIRFYQERFEAPSVQVPRTAGCGLSVPVHRVGHGQPLKNSVNCVSGVGRTTMRQWSDITDSAMIGSGSFCHVSSTTRLNVA